MPVDREAAYAALAARLTKYLGPFLADPQTVLRVPRASTSVDAGEQPMAFVVATHHVPVIADPLPARWTLHATLVLLAKCPEDQSTAETVLNAMIMAAEGALQRQSDEDTFSPGQALQTWTTLSGTVLYAQPAGPVEIELGAQSGQGVAYFPIQMVMVPT